MSQTAPSPQKRLFLLAFLVLFTVIACLIASELLLRATRRIAPPAKVRLYRENPNGTGSYRLIPDIDTTTRAGGRTIRVRTNALGMGWRPVRVPKPPNVRRIAFVGDSFTFGIWADSAEKSFVGIFDSIVSPQGHEILNFGVPGYGMGDVLLQVEEDVLPFRPDDVILVFYTGNDFVDTFLGIDKFNVVDGVVKIDEAVVRAKVPSAFREGSALRKKRSGTFRRMKTWVKRRSELYKFISGMRVPSIRTDFRVNPNFLSRTFWCQKTYPPVGDEAVHVTLKTLDAIADLCARHGIRLLIAAMPIKDQVYSETEHGADFDIYRPQHFVEEFAGKRGIPFLDLLPAMRRDAKLTRRRFYVPKEVHLNNEGHEVAGKTLAAWYENLRKGDRSRAVGEPSAGRARRRGP